MTAPTFPRNAVALVIGIGRYQRAERIAGLSYAARDARGVARLLRKEQVCGFPPDRVKLLTDERADRASLVRHLSRWLSQEARGAELVVIYFAGHGTVEQIGGREEGYLLPYDADPDDVVTHGVAMGDVARWIEGLDARAVLVCLDCCHAGGILPAQGLSLRATDRDMIRPSHLERLGGRGRFLIASCDRGQKSIEADELRHGLFTYHLLRGLQGAGDRDGDGRVTIAELFGYVSTAVSRDARSRFQREQTPWTWATYNEDVVLSVVPERTRGDEPPARPSASGTGEPLVPTKNEAAGEPTPPEDEPAIERLRRLRKRPDAAEVPFVFRNLAHRSDQVRSRARQALSALEWDIVVRCVEDLARRAEADPVAAILEGLGALESHTRIVALLDRLASVLRGPQRDRAIWLLDRKRLALECDRLAGVFRDTKSIYEIVKVLGPGTYTGAYLARQEMTGLEVVIRVLRPEYVGEPVVRSHFLELAMKAVRLVHQNLVLTREVRSLPDSSLYYTVRDYIRGVTLREVLLSGRRFERAQACKILRQVLDALVPLHRDGLVHAGIKPSNIFLMKDDHVVLGDPSLPMPTVSLDLPRLAYDFRYAPPELFRAEGKLSPASDFYSLGCVAYELIHGQPPFVSDSPFELVARHDRDAPPTSGAGPLSAAIDGWLRKLLAKQPDQRFVSIDQVRLGLDQLDTLWSPHVHAGEEREERPRRASIDVEWKSMPSQTLGGSTGKEDSVHLLRDQSLMDLADQHSIVPLTHGDGGPPGSASDEAEHRPLDFSRTVPGYEILSELGRGGMGVVYKARQIALNRPVALKMILTGAYAGSQDRQRFLSEAKAAAAIQHPNIVQVIDLGMHEGLLYFALEFCPGGSLAHRLAGTPLPPREAAELVGRLARAMQAAHSAGIIHRDLKPANVLLDAAGQPKITDFGLARTTRPEEAGLTHSGAILGTPSYMSPEQARGDSKAVGPATDIWALGAMLYECLTGRPPFRAASTFETIMEVMQRDPVAPRKLNAAVPRDLESICLKCLHKDPSKRYSSAGELADDLARWLQGGPVTAPAPARARRSWWPFG